MCTAACDSRDRHNCQQGRTCELRLRLHRIPDRADLESAVALTQRRMFRPIHKPASLWSRVVGFFLART